MPRIAHRTAYKAAADGFSLSLAVQYALHCPPGLVHSKHPDVIAHNPLVFTLAGASNGSAATPDQLVSSKATSYVVEYLRQNAVELGLDHVSDIAISDIKQHPSFTVTFACAEATDLIRVRPVLESLHLEYTWKILTHGIVTPPSDFDDSDPFAAQLTLPLWTLLNQVVLRFVKNGLVRRYPLAFGHLARQFNNEMVYFQPMIMSITQILRRSVDPAFRSQCGHLIKILQRRFTAGFNLDCPMEILGREGLQQVDLTKTVFYLSMRIAFKASMKIVEFRRHTHAMDVEDQELLELKSPRPSITCPLPLEDIPLPLEDILSDGDARRIFRGSSLFDMLDLPQFGGKYSHEVPSTDALPMDTDSEDEYCMLDLPGTSVGDIGLDLDGSDEELSPWSSVANFADQSGGYLPSYTESSQCLKESSGNTNLSQTQIRDRIYADGESFSIPSTGDGNTQEPFYGTTVTDSHTTLLARSGDAGASQANSGLNQMGHLERHRLQVARNISQTEASAASIALDLEVPLDLDDDDYLDIDDEDLAFCQPREPEDYEYHYSKANSACLTNHGFDHEDFLDVISEELLSDEELDMDGLFDREDAMCHVRCSTIVPQRDTVDSACEGVILEDETEGSDTENSASYISSFLQQKIGVV